MPPSTRGLSTSESTLAHEARECSRMFAMTWAFAPSDRDARGRERIDDLKAAKIAAVMSPSPQLIRSEALAVEAVQLMDRHSINQLLVIDEEGMLTGALNMHDLFRAKVI